MTNQSEPTSGEGGGRQSNGRPSRRRRWLAGLLAPIVAIGGYSLMWFTVPGFAKYTRNGLRDLGLYEGAYDPGRRDLIVRDGRRYLWAGKDDAQHFDITETRLEPGQIHYGLGREHFPALIAPEFVTVGDVLASGAGKPRPMLQAAGNAAPVDRPRASTSWLHDDARVLAVRVGDEVKVYPLQLLLRHELVNDVVGGRPIFAAYCYLADLGAIYDRRVGEHELTFALSGYTYFDPDVWDGRDAFVLWDRDTESLWWPLLGRAVSGPLMDAPLRVLDETLWSQTTFGEIRARYPHALVLARDQVHQPPNTWPKITVTPRPTTRPEGAVTETTPPRWNENPDLG